MRWIGQASVAVASDTAGDVTFTYANDSNVPSIGGRAQLVERGETIGQRPPQTVMFVYALKDNGELAANAAWRCDHGNTSITNNGHTIKRYDLTQYDEAQGLSTGQYTAATATGVPSMALRANTSYSSSTMEWTGSSNRLDLGSGNPSSGTKLELVLHSATPSDTAVLAYVKDPAAADVSSN